MNHIHNEILTQYAAMAHSREVLDAHVASIAQMLERTKRLVFIGCGSSYSLCKSGAWLAQSRFGRCAIAIPAGDLLLHMDEYRKILNDCALIVLSRSGETSECVRAVQGMRTAGIAFELLSLVCVPNSTLAQLSDIVIEMPWAFDESVCQTRTVSCLYFGCTYLIAMLSGDHHLVDGLLLAAGKGSAFLARIEAEMERFAQMDWSHAVVLADGEISGLCEEGALAFKEICQLPSNHYHLLDVRHGPIVLIGKDTLVIAVLSARHSQLERDLLHDIIKQGAIVVCYSDEPVEIPGAHCICFGEPLPMPARGLPAINICQLISYYKSFVTQVDPDHPTGLDAWIAL